MSGTSQAIDADWLRAPTLARVFAALTAEGDEARVIGGAVRNELLGEPVTDIDIATTATPDRVLRLAAAAGLKTAPTGLAHGTVTVIADHQPFEVTTLREDVETDGRRAVVRFTTDWTADALRRDFTINAMSATLDGRVFDPGGGIADCAARRVRFIGEPVARIREDYLRILRFFRFHAQYGAGPLDAAGLAAVIAEREGLRRLSVERIWQEFSRLLIAPGAYKMLEAMAAGGILDIVLPGARDLAAFARLRDAETALGRAPCAPLAVATLLGLASGDRMAGEAEERLREIAAALKWSNADRDRAVAAIRAARDLPARDDRDARRLIYVHGLSAYRDGLLLAAAAGKVPLAAVGAADAAAPRIAPPKFPLAGRDLLACGVPRGPEVGARLAELEQAWIASDFRLDRAALLARFNPRS